MHITPRSLANEKMISAPAARQSEFYVNVIISYHVCFFARIFQNLHAQSLMFESGVILKHTPSHLKARRTYETNRVCFTAGERETTHVPRGY